jgi:transcriptional regulator with XRE-family HTH domain
MQIHEKIRLMRQCKDWTQEEMAEKLGWAVNSYAKIERGETDVKFEKLRKVADTLGVDINELISPDEKTVLNFAENCDNGNLAHCTIVLSETQCAHELEKAQLIIQQQKTEIDNLKQQIKQLEEINQLLKESKMG